MPTKLSSGLSPKQSMDCSDLTQALEEVAGLEDRNSDSGMEDSTHLMGAAAASASLVKDCIQSSDHSPVNARESGLAENATAETSSSSTSWYSRKWQSSRWDSSSWRDDDAEPSKETIAEWEKAGWIVFTENSPKARSDREPRRSWDADDGFDGESLRGESMNEDREDLNRTVDPDDDLVLDFTEDCKKKDEEWTSSSWDGYWKPARGEWTGWQDWSNSGWYYRDWCKEKEEVNMPWIRDAETEETRPDDKDESPGGGLVAKRGLVYEHGTPVEERVKLQAPYPPKKVARDRLQKAVIPVGWLPKESPADTPCASCTCRGYDRCTCR